MTDTHTPGPWMPQFVGGRWSIWAGLDHPKVCQLGVLNEDNKADAHLIAAAPDLLEALKTIAYEPIGDPEASHRDVLEQVVQIARAAIAKTPPEGREYP